LDIFEQTGSTIESIELVKEEVLIFKRYQLDIKDIECLLQWWQIHEAMFPIVGFLTQQILGIIESQIEIERIFLWLEFLRILINVVLQTKKLEKLIFVNKNWPCEF
jgi:hypothetical protein